MLNVESQAGRSGWMRRQIQGCNEVIQKALNRIFADRREQRVAIYCLAVAVAAWALLLFLTTPTYEAVMIVGPTPANARSSISDLVPSSALSLLGMSPLSSSARNDYQVFRELLASEEVAGALLRRPGFKENVLTDLWNPAEHKWREGRGLTAALSGVLHGVLGVKDVRTDRSRVAEYLDRTVIDVPMERTGFDRITVDNRNPAVARALLTAVYQADDDYLRHLRAARLEDYLGYLRGQLSSASNEAERAALINLIVDQERELMLVRSGQPFAAELVRSPAVENRPVAPRPFQWLLIALLGGAVAASTIVYRMRSTRRRPAARQGG
jgi:hypothetical protein